MVVIQGWEREDYLDCIRKLNNHGCITEYMGIGSVCREEKDKKLKEIILTCRAALPNVKLHAFGIKKTMLRDREVVEALDSSDSFAWSLSNQHRYDLRGKDRREYLGVWAREVELTAWKSLLNGKILEKNKQKTLEMIPDA